MAYTGRILINTRVAKELSRTAKLSFSPERRLPNEDELDRLLSFLGLYALADGLLYDSTVPSRYLDEFLSASDEIGIDKQIGPLRQVTGNEFVEMASEALQMATKSIRKAMADVPPAWRQPDPTDVERFFRCASAMGKTHTENERLEIAMDEFNEDTHGGKLLVALATDCNNGLLREVALLANHGESTKGDALSVLISNFRTFLLLRWSALDGAIFATSPEYVQNVSEYNVSLD